MVEALVVVVTLAITIALAISVKAEKRAGARALARYASARALRHEGERVIGTEGGIHYSIAIVDDAGGLRTRVVSDAHSARGATFRLAVRGDGFVLSTGAHLEARAWIDEAREALTRLAVREGTWVRADGHAFECSLPGIEGDVGLLDAARDAIVMLARAVQRTGPYR